MENNALLIPNYFRPTVKRLLIFTILSFGLYEFYWSYRNWDAIKVNDKSDISPGVRAIISIVYLVPLLKRMAKDLHNGSSSAQIRAVTWGIIYILITIAGSYFADVILDGTVFATVAACIFLSLMQNFLYKHAAQPVVFNGKITRGEILVIVAGCVIAISNIFS